MPVRLRVSSLLTILALGLAVGGPFSARASMVRRNVEIEWDAAQDATSYEVEIRRQDQAKSKPTRFKLKTSKWSANVAPGLYQMRIRAYDDRDVPGEWGPASDLQVRLPAIIVNQPLTATALESKSERNEKVEFKWEVIPGAAKYRLHLESTTSDFKLDRDGDEPHVKLNLPVGQSFTWNASAIDDKDHAGEMSRDGYTLTVNGPRLPKPKIERPLSKFVHDLEWHGSEFADHYKYELSGFDEPSKKWVVVEQNENFRATTLPMDIHRPSGRYRMSVQALHDYRAPSLPAQLEFQSRGGFRSEDEFARERLRDSIVKPYNYYAIASYLITKVQYNALEYDTNSRTNFDAIGGTGRVGLGYQKPESSWGAFAIADLSGFTINGQNFKFASEELHVTRKVELGQKGLFLLGGGVFSKELPIINGDPQNGLISVGKVRGMGPHIGAVYWQPITDRFGLQANARVYSTMFGTTSTGQKSEASLSYQYGLLASYRLNELWMGYLGYAFRADTAVYDATSHSIDPASFAADGDKNTITIQGHYLNLMLEYSF